MSNQASYRAVQRKWEEEREQTKQALEEVKIGSSRDCYEDMYDNMSEEYYIDDFWTGRNEPT